MCGWGMGRGGGETERERQREREDREGGEREREREREGTHFALHHDLDFSRLHDVETLGPVSLRRREEETQTQSVSRLTDGAVNGEPGGADVRRGTSLLTCMMMRSPSENCFMPNTSTIFILSDSWEGGRWGGEREREGWMEGDGGRGRLVDRKDQT